METYDRYYDVLELPKDASLSEIRNAYLHLKRLYSTESMATSPVMVEFSDQSRACIINQIEEAYAKLEGLLRNGYRGAGQNGRVWPTLGDEIQRCIDNTAEFDGRALREIRKRMNIGLSEMAAKIKVTKSQLKHLEEEKFDAMPPEVYLKGFVSAYARFLSLNPDRVVRDYMRQYGNWRRAHFDDVTVDCPITRNGSNNL